MIVKDMVSAMREELHRLRVDNEKLTYQAAKTALLESQIKDYEKKFEAFYAAVGTLAFAIPPMGKQADREIRSKARNLLVSAGIGPPPSLGSPRVRKKKRQKKLRTPQKSV